ncbi:MAG: hypothetical protein ACTSPL_04020 [Candidatus Odinarchaeia archaeon]
MTKATKKRETLPKDANLLKRRINKLALKYISEVYGLEEKLDNIRNAIQDNHLKRAKHQIKLVKVQFNRVQKVFQEMIRIRSYLNKIMKK